MIHRILLYDFHSYIADYLPEESTFFAGLDDNFRRNLTEIVRLITINYTINLRDTIYLQIKCNIVFIKYDESVHKKPIYSLDV